MGHDKSSCNIIQVRSTALFMGRYRAHFHTHACCCICLTDFSDLANEPAGDNNTSSSLPSCASLLYSYQLQQLADVTVSCYQHNWRPWIQRHTIATHTHVTFTAVFAMSCENNRKKKLCIFAHTGKVEPNSKMFLEGNLHIWKI